MSTRRRWGRLRWTASVRWLLAAAVLICATAAFTTSDTSRIAAGAGGPVTKSGTATRTFVDPTGKSRVVSRNHVSVTVSETKDLRSLQLIDVSWTGGHPTGGLVADQNSDLAQNEEYPMVLLECRGVDSTSVPAGQRLSPDTCWTQFADERFNYGYTSWPAWRSDLYAPAGERRAFVYSPHGAKLPTSCRNILTGTSYQRWVPFHAAGGTTYPGGPFGCAGLPPEASPANFSSLTLPSNETFGVTGRNGDGEAEFDIFTAEDHASLGCSQTVPCSLVAIPMVGLSCDPAGTAGPGLTHPTGTNLDDATRSCESNGNYQPGQILPSQGSGDPAVDGSLWWSASNWHNRIVVPLTFAPRDDACALGGDQHEIDVYGSELMIQATTQWAPTFCLDSKLFDFNHVQTPEPQARSLLATGNIEAAFTSDAQDGGYSTPTVNAPTAVTGFGIAFDVDNARGHAVHVLHLDARLLAKLLTESYPDQPFVRNSYNALANNPLNITQDPEFQALNPGIPKIISDAAATLLALSSDSDVMYALTSYINADPDARAWLDGVPDPWGMVVNRNYLGIRLPVNNWPLLDTFEPKDEYQIGRNDCLAINPVPYLPLVAAPTARLFSIGQDMQFALAQSQTTCVLPDPTPGSTRGAKLVASGRQASGHHFMLGIVSLGDAAREGLQIAQLESQASPTAPVTFTDRTGRTFVGPTSAGLRATAAMLKFDAKSGTWPIPYRAMRYEAAGADAYPGTMVVYTAVPLSGLSHEDAADYATLLRYISSTGQRPGTVQGDLAPGYLPMTAHNGLGELLSYTRQAATAIAAQQGTLHPGQPSSPPPTSSSSSVPPTSGPSSPRGPSTHPSTSGSGRPPSSGHSPPAGSTPPATGGDTAPGTSVPAPPSDGTTPVPTTVGTATPVGSTESGRPSGSPSGSASGSPSGSTMSGSPTGPAPSSISASPAAAITPKYGSGLGGVLLPVVLAGAVVAIAGAVVVRVRSRSR